MGSCEITVFPHSTAAWIWITVSGHDATGLLSGQSSRSNSDWILECHVSLYSSLFQHLAFVVILKVLFTGLLDAPSVIRGLHYS